MERDQNATGCGRSGHSIGPRDSPGTAGGASAASESLEARDMTFKTFDRIAQVSLRNALWLEASYLEDIPDKHSLRKAFGLVRRAVKLGLKEARGSLAYAYDRADSVRPSRRMAVHWYRKAWRSGSSGAARNLGITMRMEGRTTSAILWFRRAIAAGDPDARFDLAKMLLEDPDRCVEAVRLLRE